jgi:dTDP-4-amino-4,6-dideoxygalactose transaminase
MGDHLIDGINRRLVVVQDAILSVKLKRLPEWTRVRQNVATEYGRLLARVDGVTLPVVAPGREHVYHLYVIRHEKRDELARHLATQGIQTVVNYPVALPFLPAYAYLKGHPEQFPNAWRNQARVLSLPIFPEMTTAQVAAVADAVSGFA